MKFEDKYAPLSLADVVFPSAAIKAQIMAIALQASDDDLLLHGPHGTGKSTVAGLIYKEWYGYLPLGTPAFVGPEMSTDAKAEGLLKCIQNMGNFDKNFGGHGLVIIDELDAASKNTQYRLREIMQSGGRQVQFVFTTNHPTKVYTGIRSACRVIEFPHPTPEQWLPRAQHILQAEGVFLPDANVLRILAASTGDIRQTCRVLQDTVLANMPPTAPPAMPAVSLILPTAHMGQPTP